MRRTAALSSIAAAFVGAAPALAQGPAGAPASSPAPMPAPAQQATISFQQPGSANAIALTGSRVKVRGEVPTFVFGQQAVVRVYRGGRKVRVKRLTVQPGAEGTGRFVLGHRLERPGTLTVRVEVGGVQAAPRTLRVLPRRVGPGSGRTSVRLLQERLRRLGYVVGRRGRYDARTARAVLAFRKVTGMARTSTASTAVMRRIARGGGRFRVRRPEHGRHVEADLSRQVVALIDRGRVLRIYPTSSGAPGTPTIRGGFRVYRKDFGANAIGMVHSSYFIRGYAIHGYHSVPTYNASHGCLRVPIPDALSIFRWVRHGTRVDVYA